MNIQTKEKKTKKNKQTNGKEVYNMKHHMKGILRRIGSIALVAIFATSMAIPAFAADHAYSEGTDHLNPAQAFITKIFQMPVNTTVPDSTFTFTFQKQGMITVAGATTPEETLDTSAGMIAGMPDIADKTISFTAADPVYDTNGDVKRLVKQVDFLTGLTADDWGNGVGIYKYQIKENQSGITIKDSTLETDIYSTARYNVEIWVDEDADGILFIHYVNVKTVAGYPDEYYPGDPGDTKVKPRPDQKVPGEDDSFDNTFSGVIFTNTYYKIAVKIDNPKENALEIIKHVKGNNAELGKYFEFKVTVTKPSLVPAPQTYKAVVLDKSGAVVTTVDNSPAMNADQSISFPSGTETTVYLKADQRLAFVDLHVGSTVAAEEQHPTGYIPSYLRTFPTSAEFKGTADASWGFPRTPGDVGPHYTLDGKNTNVVTFTNTRKDGTPMGVSVDNLPYIAVIGLAAAGLSLYVADRVRKNKKQAAQMDSEKES